jgi:N,N-dimethylformamidase
MRNRDWHRNCAFIFAAGPIVVILGCARSDGTVATGQEPLRQERPSTIARDVNPHENLKKMGISGYADRMSVQPGETIRFMVSSESPQYRADIVRLIHGDPNPKGPGIKEVVIDTSVNREYPGTPQPLPLGSYAVVPDNAALQLSGSFTLTAWIAPTSQRQGSESDALRPSAKLATPTIEGLITKWSEAEQTGYGLMVDDQGRLALWLAGPDKQVERVNTGVPLRRWQPALLLRGGVPHGVRTSWYFVAATFDAANGKVSLYQQPINDMEPDPTRVVAAHTTSIKVITKNREPLLIAAYREGSGNVTGFYNGKIDNPRIYGRALTPQEIRAIQQDGGPTDAIAAWDFAADIETDKVSDTSPRKLHGRTVNLPTRAVTGHNWDATEMNFKHARDQYGAIFFHDDDLGDARWAVGFELTVQENLKSGVYAARLRAGANEDYVPFFVRPKRGTTTSRIAFLVPTFSYMAYGATGGERGYMQLPIEPISAYSTHTNGATGVVYASYLRPLTNIRPKIMMRNPWQFIADTHLVDWLEVKGFDVDIITDHDLHFEGLSLLAPYKVVLSGTHPEYPSQEMLDALHAYLRRGGRFMYMGGNGFYWVTTVGPNGHFIEVRRRDGSQHWQGAPGESHHSLTGEEGGLWRFRGLPPQVIFGVGTSGFVLGDPGVPYKRTPASQESDVAFIFEGIGPDELIGDFPSLVLDRAGAASELDRVDYALGSPPQTMILATAVNADAPSSGGAWEDPGSNPSLKKQLAKADIAYLTYPNDGAVFSTGAITWCGGLSFNNYSNNVSRITENVLRRFASDQTLSQPTTPKLSTARRE